MTVPPPPGPAWPQPTLPPLGATVQVLSARAVAAPVLLVTGLAFLAVGLVLVFSGLAVGTDVFDTGSVCTSKLSDISMGDCLQSGVIRTVAAGTLSMLGGAVLAGGAVFLLGAWVCRRTVRRAG